MQNFRWGGTKKDNALPIGGSAANFLAETKGGDGKKLQRRGGAVDFLKTPQNTTTVRAGRSNASKCPGRKKQHDEAPVDGKYYGTNWGIVGENSSNPIFERLLPIHHVVSLQF